MPPSRLPGIPDALERICLKCLRKATRDRYVPPTNSWRSERFVRGSRSRNAAPHAWQRVRDWARSEPALAARLAVIGACSAIMWGYRLIAGRYVPLPPDHWAKRLAESGILGGYVSIEAVLVWLNQAILAAWGLASWAFQRQLTRGGEQRWPPVRLAGRRCRGLCLLIELDDALMSPLTVAFAVLIVASAFWARADQILQTTLLSMSGYTVLVLSTGSIIRASTAHTATSIIWSGWPCSA